MCLLTYSILPLNPAAQAVSIISSFFKNENSIRHWVRFTKAGHLDFTDVPFMIPIMTTKGYDREKGHQLKSEVILNFLDHYLKKQVLFKKKKHQTLEWIK